MPGRDETGEKLRALSLWIDDSNAGRDPEAQTWGRLAKITEEAGEVIEAWIGVVGQNPRKGVTHELGDVVKELHDVALTALCAVEHMTDNRGDSMELFAEHVKHVHNRAGLAEPRCRICGVTGNVPHDAAVHGLIWDGPDQGLTAPRDAKVAEDA